MHITLHRQVTAVCHRILATVDIEQERPDIQKTLEQVTQNYSSLPPRAIAYLEKEGLVRDQQLTDSGREVLDSGYLLAREYGIFNAWYLDSDDYLDTLPLLLQRVEEPVKAGYQKRASFYDWPEARRESSDSELHCDADYVYVIDDVAEKKQIRNLKVEVRNGGERARQAQLNLSLVFSLSAGGSNSPNFHLKGALPVRQGDKEKQISVEQKYCVSEPEPDFMDQIADDLGYDWSLQNQRFKCTVPDEIAWLNAFMAQYTTFSQINTCYGLFDHGEARRLPLMPADGLVAKAWQEAWLIELLKERYLAPSQTHYQQQVWLEHPAVKNYRLNVLEGKALLSQLDKQQNPQSYWHASAAHFLIPHSGRNLSPSITFRNGDELEASDLLRGLVLSEPVEVIIYSDRHYKSAKHARNMQALARASGARVGVIFTEESNPRVPEGWYSEVMERQKDTHDRYWILVTEKKTVIWKCTTSLDFVDFSKPDPKVQGSPTFVQIEKMELPEYLQQALADMSSMEVAQ